MGKTEMTRYNRHDLLFISMRGRERIFQTLIKERSNEMTGIAEELMFHVFPLGKVPGIVRRSDVAVPETVSAGFVYPDLLDNNRVRISADVKYDEITDVVTPYALPHFDYAVRNKVMRVFQETATLDVCKAGKMGVVGSVGMEIITGAPYTNDNSDLDLLIKDCSYNEILKIYTNLIQIGNSHNISVDIEIELNNGYGIKAAELFIGSHTLLGKSLSDVQLLERHTVLDSLKS